MLKRLALFAAIAILLASCGFKLRGMVDMPPWLKNVAIVVQDAHKDLEPIIKKQLQAYNIRVAASPVQSDYILILEKDSLQQQITGVGASTTPRQYLLVYTLQFSLLKNKEKPVISSNVITITRQLTVNNDRILGSDFEESTINREMRKDAAMQLMGRLSRG
ncbi:LPS assembly lipoprotein LptE [Legionella dresdenensis]|uniref:LPS-assembly lipoprotein LptE n=1 Tax=Legionella dresdenensis TaxID=450200 RepID=A0ABV8CB84_9GAMM